MDDNAAGLNEIAYLMVVQRGEEDRFRVLRSAFRDKSVAVIWDRRQGERRRDAAPAGVERRRTDRRQTPPSSWNNLGFLVARKSMPAEA